MRNQTVRFIAILMALLFWATIIEAQSGGTFVIHKSVIAGAMVLSDIACPYSNRRMRVLNFVS